MRVNRVPRLVCVVVVAALLCYASVFLEALAGSVTLHGDAQGSAAVKFLGDPVRPVLLQQRSGDATTLSLNANFSVTGHVNGVNVTDMSRRVGMLETSLAVSEGNAAHGNVNVTDLELRVTTLESALASDACFTYTEWSSCTGNTCTVGRQVRRVTPMPSASSQCMAATPLVERACYVHAAACPDLRVAAEGGDLADFNGGTPRIQAGRVVRVSPSWVAHVAAESHEEIYVHRRLGGNAGMSAPQLLTRASCVGVPAADQMSYNFWMTDDLLIWPSRAISSGVGTGAGFCIYLPAADGLSWQFHQWVVSGATSWPQNYALGCIETDGVDIFVGAEREAVNGDEGAMYVYRSDTGQPDGVWSMAQRIIRPTSDTSNGGRFGVYCHVKESLLLLGSLYTKENNHDYTGRWWTYYRSAPGVAWTNKQSVAGYTGASMTGSAVRVNHDATQILVASRHQSQTENPRITVFTGTPSTSYAQSSIILVPNGLVGQAFGNQEAVRMCGRDRLLVGARKPVTQHPGGCIYVYRLQSDGTWVHETTFDNPEENITNDNLWGVVFDCDDGFLVIGSYRYPNGQTTDVGKVSAYDIGNVGSF